MAWVTTPETFAASLFGKGRNIYLEERHFWMMMAAAAIIHMTLLLGLSFWSGNDVKEIPVRVLNIKLGGSPNGSATQAAVPASTPYAAPKAMPAAIAAPTSVTTQQQVKPSTNDIAFAPAKPAPAKKTEIMPKHIKIEADKPILQKNGIPAQTNLPKITPREVSHEIAVPTDSVETTNLPPPVAGQKPVADTKAAAAEPATGQPTKYVRATGGLGTGEGTGSGAGSANGTADGKLSENEIKAKYELQISEWLGKHKHYPAAARMLGQHGKPVLRIRLDRQGNLKFSTIEKPTGFRLIDDAAIDMATRANPFPAPPSNYPGDKLLEFLIPVSFDLQ